MLTEKFPEHFVGPIDLQQVESVEVDHDLLVEDVAEDFEADVWRTAVKQDHASHVAHSLNIANVWSEWLVSDEDFPETGRERLDFFKQYIQVRKRPWDIFFY